ncbi:cobyrinate a,c-diamide synthase [Desulfovibrio legallii]|uniref:Cobyrinic acid a,c-diamide synthase n=1 Tax=Desulfovibrio legallii TaxID=571438 RepID=A0A1G7LVG6_9BACT|nr:cobyrinate a,c-diamide synthase [Desulfovibrio legallii]SDF53366.1 cobyrinic acid a,c-diamide synthase [Desulfovibrio legallii]
MGASAPCSLPRLCVAALAGGGGKTLLALGLAGALRRQGLAVQPFKKGPDYIDAAWLSLAAGRPCTNLDPYFLSPERLRALFVHTLWAAGDAEPTAAPRPAAPVLGLVEGNRGLFDGLDVAGSCSTAALARELACPVLLSLDCTKMTRTAAAVVRGVLAFEPGVPLAGVVLNRVGSARHENLLRSALETYTDLPVLGALPRLAANPLPERHMGLAAHGDALGPQAEAALERLAALAREHLDLPAVLDIARSAPPLAAAAFWPPTATAIPAVGSTADADPSAEEADPASAAVPGPAAAPAQGGGPAPLASDAASAAAAPAATAAQFRPVPPGVPAASRPGAARAAAFGQAEGAAPRIGYVRDAALWFYYRENLEALERAGARLIRLSALDAAPWPALDGLYLGGGFPEDCAPELSRSPHLADLRRLADAGLPIYAECGGFMLLSQGIEREDRLWPLAGVFAVRAQFLPRPQGLGYVCGEVTAANPFFPVGLALRGHEFHYSRCRWQGAPPAFALRLNKGVGMGRAQAGGPGLDGLTRDRVWASYTHIFAPAVPCWAANFADAARAFARGGAQGEEPGAGGKEKAHA